MARTIIANGGAACLGSDEDVARVVSDPRARALFIPTASGMHEVAYRSGYWSSDAAMRCQGDVLLLFAETPSRQEIQEKILSADWIYVGGGNTHLMLARWRELGVDEALKKAYEKGAVLSGSSAGAICWFKRGHSDSEAYYIGRDRDFSESYYGIRDWNRNWDYILVDGLNLIPAIACPHYHGEGREESFKGFVKTSAEVGIAIDDGCAIKFVDSAYKVLSPWSWDAPVYKVYRSNGSVASERLEKKNELTPLTALLMP